MLIFFPSSEKIYESGERIDLVRVLRGKNFQIFISRSFNGRINFISSWKTRPFLKRQESKRHGGSFRSCELRIGYFWHRLFSPFSLFSSDSPALGSRFITAAAFFHLIKITYTYIYTYITKKKEKEKKRYYCQTCSKLDGGHRGGLIYSAISLCARKYATGILISNRRRHSRALNRLAPLSIQCSLDMDRCIVQLPLTCLVALPIDNIKRYIENISSRPREARRLSRAGHYFFPKTFIPRLPFLSLFFSFFFQESYLVKFTTTSPPFIS